MSQPRAAGFASSAKSFIAYNSVMKDLAPPALENLLNRIGEGDDQAATTLYRHYHGFIYAYLRHRMADEDAAEEVAHDVFMAVFRRPAAFGGTSKFSTWLCGIANNKAADWGRARRRGIPVAEIDDEALAAIADPSANFVARLEEAQNDAVVRQCIDALPDIQRDAVFWAYYEDEDMVSIAERQRCPVGTVKSRLANARKKLMDCLVRWFGRNGDD